MKQRHTLGTRPYFTVSGERAEFKLDEKAGALRPTGRILPSRIRYETLSLADAEEFARAVYRGGEHRFGDPRGGTVSDEGSRARLALKI